MQDLAQNPQLRARSYFTDLWDDGLQKTLRTPGAPFKMSATPWRPGPPAPRPGQHTESVLDELGPPPSPRAAP
jgi:benzylsuccinate CoA-transferase BbsE subunit